LLTPCFSAVAELLVIAVCLVGWKLSIIADYPAQPNSAHRYIVLDYHICNVLCCWCVSSESAGGENASAANANEGEKENAAAADDAKGAADRDEAADETANADTKQEGDGKPKEKTGGAAGDETVNEKKEPQADDAAAGDGAQEQRGGKDEKHPEEDEEYEKELKKDAGADKDTGADKDNQVAYDDEKEGDDDGDEEKEERAADVGKQGDLDANANKEDQPPAADSGAKSLKDTADGGKDAKPGPGPDKPNGKDYNVNYDYGDKDPAGSEKDSYLEKEHRPAAYDRDFDDDRDDENADDVDYKQGREPGDRRPDDDDYDDDTEAYKTGDGDSDVDGVDMPGKEAGDGLKFEGRDDAELPSKDDQDSDVFRSTVLIF